MQPAAADGLQACCEQASARNRNLCRGRAHTGALTDGCPAVHANTADTHCHPVSALLTAALPTLLNQVHAALLVAGCVRDFACCPSKG